jgi:hypothetical protein
MVSCFFFINPSMKALFPRRFVPVVNRPRKSGESGRGYVEEDARAGRRSGRLGPPGGGAHEGCPPGSFLGAHDPVGMQDK